MSRGGRLSGGRARRPRLRSRRARQCASSLPAPRLRCCPLFIARIGFERATRRATRPNLRGLPNDSRYSRTRLVASIVLPALQQVVRGDVRLVADRHEGRQPKARSRRRLDQCQPERAALRREADVARRAREFARKSRSVTALPPRCRGSSGRSGVRRVRGRARASSCWRSRPRHRSRQSRRRSRTEHACLRRRRASAAAQDEVARYADDGEVDGSPGFRRPRYTRGRRRPATPSRLTGIRDPVKSARRMLRKSSPPIEPRRCDAPSTATERGAKKGCERRATAAWSRLSTCSRKLVGGSDRELDLDLCPAPTRESPGSQCARRR